MSVNWDWKQKMGEITLTQKKKDGKMVDYKINLYVANCLFAMIYDFKEKDEETGKMKDKYSFYGFFADDKHLKKCIGLLPMEEYDYETHKTIKRIRNLYKTEDEYWKKVKLNTFFKENLKTADLLARAGFKVELYYKKIG